MLNNYTCDKKISMHEVCVLKYKTSVIIATIVYELRKFTSVPSNTLWFEQGPYWQECAAAAVKSDVQEDEAAA